MGRVLLMIALVGLRNLEKRTIGLMKSKQYSATKPNWINVNVTGKRNCVRIALPVFDERADVVYHSEQSSTKRVEVASGMVRLLRESRARVDADVDSDRWLEGQYFDRGFFSFAGLNE